MDIVSAIRKLCEGKNAFHDLFDKTKSYEKLSALADDKRDAELFGALLYGKARNTLIEMINDAYHTQKVKHPTREEIIEMLTFAAEHGRETAYWKLADLYANWDRKEHHDKIEHYCRLAFASGKIFTDKEPECLYGSIEYWITEHHPEWCEMKECFRSDGSYYLLPAYPHRYGMTVFHGIGEEAARQKLNENKGD